MLRLLAAATAALIFALAVPSAASATVTLTQDGSTIVVTEIGGAASDRIELAQEGGDHLIREEFGGLSDQAESCSFEAVTEHYRCSGVTAFRLELGGGPDKVRFTGAYPIGSDSRVDVPLTIAGGDGNDELQGGIADDTIRGGAGEDDITGFEGADVLDPGAGSDFVGGGTSGSAPNELDTVTYADRTEPIQVELGSATTTFNGSAADASTANTAIRDRLSTIDAVIAGSGDDVLSTSVRASLNGAGGADRITGGPEADSLEGAAGADVIEGEGGGDLLTGDAGDDTLVPGAGEDTVSAGAGFDFVEARDGEIDAVNCGGDGDIARADATDDVEECDPPPPAIQKETIVERETVVDRQTVTVTAPGRVPVDLGYSFSAGRRATALRELWLDTEPGARVTAACRTRRGRRCPRTRDISTVTASGRLRLRGFERKALPVGAALTISAQKDGMVSGGKTLTVRKRKAPAVRRAS